MCKCVLHGTQAVLTDVHVTADGAVTHLGRPMVWTSLDPRPVLQLCTRHQCPTPETWIPILRGCILTVLEGMGPRAWVGPTYGLVHGACSHACVGWSTLLWSGPSLQPPCMLVGTGAVKWTGPVTPCWIPPGYITRVAGCGGSQWTQQTFTMLPLVTIIHSKCPTNQHTLPTSTAGCSVMQTPTKPGMGHPPPLTVNRCIRCPSVSLATTAPILVHES